MNEDALSGPQNANEIRNLAKAWCERSDVPKVSARIIANPVEAFIAGYAAALRVLATESEEATREG